MIWINLKKKITKKVVFCKKTLGTIGRICIIGMIGIIGINAMIV